MKNILNKIVSKAIEFKERLICFYFETRKAIRETSGGFVSQQEQQQMTGATWPPVSGVTPGFVMKGKTTIRWGTDGLLAGPVPASGFYTVTRFNQKPVLDRTKLPNGTGITATDIMLTDGYTWEITVRDDTTIVPPAVFTNVTLVDAVASNGTVGNVWTARIVDLGYDTANKKEGERTFTCDNLILIDTQVNSGQSGN